MTWDGALDVGCGWTVGRGWPNSFFGKDRKGLLREVAEEKGTDEGVAGEGAGVVLRKKHEHTFLGGVGLESSRKVPSIFFGVMVVRERY